MASEKQYPCLLMNKQGTILETVWEGPGGVMTMEPLNDGTGAFLATHRFYSPNDSAQASIVLAERGDDGWKVRTLCPLPFVHRFGILERDGKRYLAAMTLKSAHAFKDDWTCPGRIWVGELPDDLSVYGEENPLPLTPLVSGLTRNHGFFKMEENGYTSCLVGTENGIYKVIPPADGGAWEASCILPTAASDMLLADFDGDGAQELLLFAPFHGDVLTVYKLQNGEYHPVYHAPEPMPFLHAIGCCQYDGRDVAVIGYRKGKRELLMVRYGNEGYECAVIDHDVGPANVLCREDGSGAWILSANREIDEVAIYRVTP